ncbi:translesion error-prone DNA polymerase V subunit UmuC [Salmonella enterica]|nr:translesion error-prone DNA polymerase V subunit UmuC [Salmonella enterica]
MFALADINSFYASCEKVFRPDLRNEPVIVLSNNDGCVIARSPEAKALGIRMGQPWFQVRQMRLEKKIHVFSSNYALYHSMSQRVMAVLESLSPAVEPYSIDEMFIDLRGINHCIAPEVFGHQLREQVKSWTGLTMGVGIAPTKTLAKSAQWATKQWTQFSGVVALTAENRNRTLKLLGLQPVGEVWGVGRRLTEKLNALGINTALQLAQANTAFIRKNFSVILERTVRELNGESCISLEEAPPAKQQIVCSRSFGERITDKDAMHQAVVQYAERAAEKLRGERQYCRQVTTFVRTSPFAVKEPCYSNAAVEKLPLPTQDSRDIIAAACRALNHVWREGYRYMKAGVMLADFTPSGIAQPGLFDEIQPRKNSEKLMKTLDELNQSGKGKVWFAGRGTAPEWQMKREMLSQCYTTKWRDIPLARLG